MSTAFISGFLLGASLILPIGAQNAFVLRQGLQQASMSSAVCADLRPVGCDTDRGWRARLRRAGHGGAVAGAGDARSAARRSWPVYGLRSLWSAMVQTGRAEFRRTMCAEPRAATIVACLAFTWLNPHVYLGYRGAAGFGRVQGAGARRLRGGDDGIDLALGPTALARCGCNNRGPARARRSSCRA